jgi:hypothetical protein
MSEVILVGHDAPLIAGHSHIERLMEHQKHLVMMAMSAPDLSINNDYYNRRYVYSKPRRNKAKRKVARKSRRRNR